MRLNRSTYPTVMAAKKNRRKACWNCDSEIDLDIMICPYCASDLSGSRSSQKKAPEPVFVAPPVRDRDRAPQPIFRAAQPQSDYSVATELPNEGGATVSASGLDESKRLLLSLLFFLLGSVFFLFSLALLLLSDGETLTLRWKAALWPLFIILAVPLLVLGFKTWKGLDHDGS